VLLPLRGFFGCPILRRCRIAIATRKTPIAIFAASAPSEDAVFGLGGLLPVARTVIATTIARDTSHPNTNAAPFTARASHLARCKDVVLLIAPAFAQRLPVAAHS